MYQSLALYLYNRSGDWKHGAGMTSTLERLLRIVATDIVSPYSSVVIFSSR